MPHSTTAVLARPRHNTRHRTRSASKTRADAVPGVNVDQRLRGLRLERNLSIRAVAAELFVLTLEPNADSGPHPIVQPNVTSLQSSHHRNSRDYLQGG